MPRVFPPFSLASLWSGSGNPFDPTELEAKLPAATGVRFNAFRMIIQNNSGAIQHRIVALANSGTENNPSDDVSQINGASVTFANTPSGPNGSTAFVNGAKLNSDNDAFLLLDAPAQTVSQAPMLSSVSYNDSDTVVDCSFGMILVNVNGVTRIRPQISFFNSATGALFGLNSTNLNSGERLEIDFLGWLKASA